MAERAQGITAITVGGYKSIRDETTIEIRPLTILAGANSSGKSSIMQPMLLMKQTLDATHDPGLLLLDGPHIQFTHFEQLIPIAHVDYKPVLATGYKIDQETELVCEYKFPKMSGGNLRHVELQRMKIFDPTKTGIYEITPEMFEDRTTPFVPEALLKAIERKKALLNLDEWTDWGWTVKSSRCFFRIELYEMESAYPVSEFILIDPLPNFQINIENLIHVSGSRVGLRRIIPVTTAQGSRFPGQFQHYAASLILRWQEEANDKLDQVEKCLRDMRLTRWVEANRINDISVELKVSRLPVTSGDVSRSDSVNIADVGSSVSLALPVLMALVVAEPEQLVYIEQPESDLHPRAQVALAGVLADAAQRGVRVVIETHSSLLLQGILTQIAQGELDHKDVILHWFSRDEEGYTKVDSVEPDENGAYGDWPEDFGDVELEIMGKYLNAVGERDAVPDNA